MSTSERWINVVSPARGRGRAAAYESLYSGGVGFDEPDFEPARPVKIKCTFVPEGLRDDELQALVQIVLDDGYGAPLPLFYPDVRAYALKRRLVTKADVEAEEAGA